MGCLITKFLELRWIKQAQGICRYRVGYLREAREEHLHCVKISVASLDISVPLAIDGDFPGTLQLVSGDLWSPDVAVIKTRLNKQ